MWQAMLIQSFKNKINNKGWRLTNLHPLNRILEMIDYIAINKHFQGKDKPFFGNCQEEAFYANSGEIKYTLSGCRTIEIFWNENLHRLKLRGSLLYYFQNHNFTYSDEVFKEAVEYLERILNCSLWDSNVDEFEYGVIIEVERKPKEYLIHHFARDKKLLVGTKPKSQDFFRWWEDTYLSLKMYDENRNIKLKQKKSEMEVLKQAGWNPELNYLKWEVHYKKPHLLFNTGRFLRLADLLNPTFQMKFRQDLLYQYSRLFPLRALVPPTDKKCAKTVDILLEELVEVQFNNNIPLGDIKKSIYARINSYPESVLSKNDKKARKRQVSTLLNKLKEAENSPWNLSELIKKRINEGNTNTNI